MEQIEIKHIKNKNISVYDLTYSSFYLIIVLILWLIGRNGLTLISPIILIFSSLFLVFRVRNSRFYLFLSMVIFLFNFSIAVSEYIDVERQILFTGVASDEFVMKTSINVMNIFMVALNLFIKTPKNNKQLPFVENKLVFNSLCAIFLLLCIMKIILRYEVVNKMFEYCNILFLFLCFTSNNNKKKRNLVVALLAVYIVTLSLSVFVKKEATGRIDFIQSFFVVFLYFFIEKLKFLHLCLIAVAVVIVMCIMVSMRGGVVNSMSFSKFIKEVYEAVLLNDTAHFAYASSTTIVAYKKYYAPVEMPLLNFLQFFIAQFIGTGSSLTSKSVLSLITREYYVHYYGTCLPFYFYFWLGYLGVFIGGAGIALFINGIDKSKKPLASLIFIMIFSTVFRWYLYSPNTLFRGCIILTSFVYLMVKLLNNKAKVHFE